MIKHTLDHSYRGWTNHIYLYKWKIIFRCIIKNIINDKNKYNWSQNIFIYFLTCSGRGLQACLHFPYIGLGSIQQYLSCLISIWVWIHFGERLLRPFCLGLCSSMDWVYSPIQTTVPGAVTVERQEEKVWWIRHPRLTTAGDVATAKRLPNWLSSTQLFKKRRKQEVWLIWNVISKEKLPLLSLPCVL